MHFLCGCIITAFLGASLGEISALGYGYIQRFVQRQTATNLNEHDSVVNLHR